MNKYSKLFALLGTAFLLGSCQEDSLLQSEGPLSGNEIRFGATAHFKNGNSSTTRTEYGDIEKDENGNGFIEVRWSNGDRIDIACPSTAGTNCAEYVVSGFDHGTDKDGNNQNGAQNSTATTLTKTGDAGLQWGSSEDNYTFYSVYPSFNTIKSHLQGVMPDAELNNLGVSKEGKLAGYLAQVQDAAPASVDNARNNLTEKDGKNGYVIKPNMDFAYMVAKTPNVGYGNDVSLSFESIVTALEFQIFAPDIVGETAGDITVTGFALSDPDNGDICGPFNYDYNTEAYATPDEGAASGHSLVQMNILGTDGEGVTITKDQYVDVTFFLLPRADEQTYGTLDLTVFYKVGISSQVKTATLNKPIAPRTKTYIKNIKLPQITNVNASSWWSALPPATLFSQVSIPVAGNVFATKENIVLDGSLASYDETYFHQQTKTISDLWSMGVRGFELCCQSALTKTMTPANIVTQSIGAQNIVAAEAFVTNKTFDGAFTDLITLHSQKGYESEPLILICTYTAKNDGYNPYNYVANLLNYFNGLSEEIKSKFVKLTTSTTVGDLRGKIAVIIRPGDDLRWLYETQTSNNNSNLYDPYTQLGITSYPEGGLTARILSVLQNDANFTGKDMLSKVMLVADWGASSYDMWNRRYGAQFGMDETSYKKLPDSRKTELNNLGMSTMFMESFLYASNRNNNASTYAWSGQDDDNNFNNFGGDALVVVPSYGTESDPSSTDGAEFNFEHSMSNGGKAYVQEWHRVVPDGGIPATKLHSGGINIIIDTRYSIWVKWPGSITEKKEAIKDLFNMSVATKGTAGEDLFINVLSGYYATTKHAPSITPITESITTSRGTKNDFTNQGKGGDYEGLAYDLNNYVYELLSATPGAGEATRTKLKQQGPWGLVVLNHIGTNPNDKSVDLVDLIMMNNFRFPLAIGSYNEQGGTGSGSGGSGE